MVHSKVSLMQFQRFAVAAAALLWCSGAVTAGNHTLLRPHSSSNSSNSNNDDLGNSLGGDFSNSAHIAVNLILNNFNGYPMVPEPTHKDTTDGRNFGIPQGTGQDLIASLLGYIGTYAQDVGRDFQLGAGIRGLFGSYICDVGYGAMQDLIGDVKFNTESLGAAPYSAGIGAGWGFQLYCNNNLLFSFGMGLGGGIITNADGTSFGGGFGGGGGAAANGFSAGGGGGFSFDIGEAFGMCNSVDDPGADPSFDLPANVVSQLRSCIEGGSLTLCGGGGGGGGFDSHSGHYGGGFGFSMSGTIGTFQHPSHSVNCPASTLGEGGNSAGQAAQDCRNACQPGTAFYSCFCKCFKTRAAALGLSWASQMSCPT